VQLFDELVAKDAIRRLMHDYSHGMDKRDVKRFLGIWDDEAEWGMGPGHEVTGLSEIQSAAETIWAEYRATHHYNANGVIDLAADGTSATGMVDVIAVAHPVQGESTQTSATYRDTYRRTAAGWRITRRSTEVHQLVGPPNG
jgi:uncharacterized protein (TIGR02246 family)